MRRRIQIANRRGGGLWWRAPIVLLSWLAIAAPIVAMAGVLLVVREHARDLPAVPDLERWEATVPRTSTLVAADGSVVAELPFSVGAAVGHRMPIAYRDLPPRLVQAILAAEDLRFFSHRGVDLRAVARAALANYRAGAIVEGASTITQQVARNLLPSIGDERSLRRKIREALLARRIERRYSKRRILETYANFVFLGGNAYGVAAAARAYFDAPLAELSVAQCALLAGLIQAPGRTDPFVDLEAARTRRDEVLARMHRAGMLDDAELGRALAEAIELSPPPRRYGSIAPWHTERVRQEIAAGWPELYARGGLVVETTARPALAARALDDARAWSERLDADAPPEIGALVIDHATGYVEANLGGLDWHESQFDRATQACRQPGSAFKPIVYAAALDEGAITPGTPLRDGPVAEWDAVLGVHWKPSTGGHEFRGVALAHDALAASLNTPAIDVLDRVGTGAVVALARRLGVASELAEVRPLALGASCVVPLELAEAFAVFARGGTKATPIYVKAVRARGKLLIDRAAYFDPQLSPSRRLDRVVVAASSRKRPVLDPRVAFQISAMLRDVVLRGTGTAARSLGRPAAGKTGTTNDNTDAWFVGYTTRVVAAVWVGHDDPSRTLGPRQDGGRAALPLWMKVVARAEGERPAGDLPGTPPPGLTPVRVDRDSGLLAAPGAGGAIELHFEDGTAPTEVAGSAAAGASDFARASRGF